MEHTGFNQIMIVSGTTSVQLRKGGGEVEQCESNAEGIDTCCCRVEVVNSDPDRHPQTSWRVAVPLPDETIAGLRVRMGGEKCGAVGKSCFGDRGWGDYVAAGVLVRSAVSMS